METGDWLHSGHELKHLREFTVVTMLDRYDGDWSWVLSC